ncbi:TPA: hypothetical protein QDB07_003582 [Burkholderia vietnamiensis]|nr:hypothetical protein [Burkholderia vietnamiensis]
MKITDDMLTEWFPGNVIPERIGWYECMFLGGCGRVMLFWTGSKWTNTPSGGWAPVRSTFGIFRGDSWRGLKEKHHG